MIARGAGRWYAAQVAPFGAPPGWAFGAIWTVLSAPTGMAAWLVWRRLASLRRIGSPNFGARRLAVRRIGVRAIGVSRLDSAVSHDLGRGRPLRLWGWQVLAGALWTPAFFGLHSPALAAASVALLLIPLILLTAHAFASLDRRAAWLLAPFLAWAVLALYLATGFWWLNLA